jgi:hypothetical protein
MTARVLATITPEDMARHRDALCEWAKANGIEPRDVAARPGVTIEQTGQRKVIVYREFQRAADGSIQAHPDRPGEALTVRRAARLRVPLPTLDDQPDDHSAS